MKKRVVKRKLRGWVKVTLMGLLVVVLGGLIYSLLSITAQRYNDMYEACDNAKGYTCSYYEARLYSVRGE